MSGAMSMLISICLDAFCGRTRLNRGCGDDLAHVGALTGELGLRVATREVEQVADDVMDTLGLAVDAGQELAGLIGGRSPARSSSTKPRIADSGLPISCATPAARRPTDASFSPWINCCCAAFSSIVVCSSSCSRCSSASRSARSCAAMALNAAARRRRRRPRLRGGTVRAASGRRAPRPAGASARRAGRATPARPRTRRPSRRCPTRRRMRNSPTRAGSDGSADGTNAPVWSAVTGLSCSISTRAGNRSRIWSARSGWRSAYSVEGRPLAAAGSGRRTPRRAGRAGRGRRTSRSRRALPGRAGVAATSVPAQPPPECPPRKSARELFPPRRSPRGRGVEVDGGVHGVKPEPVAGVDEDPARLVLGDGPERVARVLLPPEEVVRRGHRRSTTCGRRGRRSRTRGSRRSTARRASPPG